MINIVWLMYSDILKFKLSVNKAGGWNFTEIDFINRYGIKNVRL